VKFRWHRVRSSGSARRRERRGPAHDGGSPVALCAAALNEEANADGGRGARCGNSARCSVSGRSWTCERWQPGNGSVTAARRAGEVGRRSGEKRERH
jgi:hypothetical protein